MRVTFTLLDLRARQDDTQLFCRVVSAWLNTLRACGGASNKGSEGGGMASERQSLQGLTREFKDDLRSSDFAYIVEESGKINSPP